MKLIGKVFEINEGYAPSRITEHVQSEGTMIITLDDGSGGITFHVPRSKASEFPYGTKYEVIISAPIEDRS